MKPAGKNGRSPVIAVLIAAVCIGAVLRLVALASYPVGFHGDEASIGYNAYSLLKTGKDQNGNRLPLVIDQWGDFRPAGYHYTAIPFIAVFGLNEFAVRLPGAVFGIASIAAMYALTLAVTGIPLTALISSLVIAVMPWHVELSRATSEAVPALFFIMAGTTLGIRVLKGKHPVVGRLAGAVVLLCISEFYYHAARVVAPVTVLALAVPFAYRFRRSMRPAAAAAGITLVALAFSAFLFIASKGDARSVAISIFANQETALLRDEQIREDQFQLPVITKILHNKPMAYAKTAIVNMSEYFSGKYLFLTGGFPNRYRIPDNGLLIASDAILFLLGLVMIAVGIGQGNGYLWFVPLYLVAGVLPAAVTFEDIPNVVRSFMMVPGLVVAVSVGYETAWRYLKEVRFGRAVLLAGGAVAAFLYVGFLHGYFHHAATHQTLYRAVSEAKLTAAIRKYAGDTRPVISTADGDNVQIFYLFYWNVDPAWYQSHRNTDVANSDRFRNIRFETDPCPYNAKTLNGLSGVLYVTRMFCPVPSDARVLQEIRRPDGTGDYRLLEKIN